MSTPKTIIAYDDIRTLLDRAVESPNGIKVTLPSYKECVTFRQRVYTFRRLDRNMSLEIYKSGDPQWGRSIYDALYLQIEGTSVLIHRPKFDLKVEDL